MQQSCLPYSGSPYSRYGKSKYRKRLLVDQELDRVAVQLPNLANLSLTLKLAFQRLHCLSWQERLLLLECVRDKEDFLSLGLAEIQSFLYRSLHLQSINMARVWQAAERDTAFLGRLGAQFICITEQEYPSLLREIHRAPFGLFVRGNVKCLCQRTVTWWVQGVLLCRAFVLLRGFREKRQMRAM